jgi:serine protease inhibitor ecotin
MRVSTAFVIVVAFSFATPAFAQAQGAQAETHAPADQSEIIRSIQVVNIKDLQPEVRSKVENVAAQTSEDDLRSLRNSIDGTPEVVAALKASGLNSSQVVAINIADGVLTLFAKTA